MNYTLSRALVKQKVNFFHVDSAGLYYYYIPMREPLHLGSIIKSRRKKLKITTEILAKKVGIDRTYISKIENYNLIPSWDILVAIGRELKIDGLHTLYLEHKHPEIIHDKSSKIYKGITAAGDKTTALRNELSDFIIRAAPKHYSTVKTFAINILNKYKPKEKNNEKLISEISQLIKKTAQDYQSYQKLYNQAENEIIKLINP